MAVAAYCYYEKVHRTMHTAIVLTLNVLCIFGSCIEMKIKLNFYFHTSVTFEAPQRSVKIKIYLNFFSLFRIGMGRVIPL